MFNITNKNTIKSAKQRDIAQKTLIFPSQFRCNNTIKDRNHMHVVLLTLAPVVHKHFYLETAWMSVLTGTTKGPSSPVQKHQPSPQMALSSSRGLVNADRDAGESDVADFHSGHDPRTGLRPLHHAIKAIHGLPDWRDVMVEAQPGLQRSLKTEKGGVVEE